MKKHGNDRAFAIHAPVIVRPFGLGCRFQIQAGTPKDEKPRVFTVLPIKNTQQILAIEKDGFY